MENFSRHNYAVVILFETLLKVMRSIMIPEKIKLLKFVMIFEASKATKKALFSKRNINHSFAWITFLERIAKVASLAAKFHFSVSSQGEVSP